MRLLFAIAIAGFSLADLASASAKCNAPLEEWQPRKVLRTKLEQIGWTVRSIRSEDGCYEAFAINEKGETVDAQFDPKSLEQVDGSIAQ